MKAINIEWDVDFHEDLSSLPTEIDIPNGMVDEDEISDYLSDVTVFCHKGFSLIDNSINFNLEDTKPSLADQIQSASARVGKNHFSDKTPIKDFSNTR